MIRRRRTQSVEAAAAAAEITALPDELLLAIGDRVLVQPSTLFHTLYCCFALVSRQWRSLFLSIRDFSPVVTQLLAHYFDAEPAPDWPRLCNNLVRLDCLHGARCIGLSYTVRYSLCDTLVELSRMGSVTTLSQCDLFNVCRALHRTRYLYGKIRGPDIWSFPYSDTPLCRLYMCLAHGTQTTIYLSLWDLRDRLVCSRDSSKVDETTAYNTLATLDGRPLVGAACRCRKSSSVGPSAKSLRSFHSLSMSERTKFLARHAARIENNLHDPSQIYRLREIPPRTFEQNLDVLSPLYEEDMRLMRGLLLSLRGQLIETDRDRASEVCTRTDVKCSFCVVIDNA